MKKITKEKVASLLAKNAKLVDIRSPVAFRDGTVAGAVNMPLKNFLNYLLGLKPTEKVVIFSDTYNNDDLRSIEAYANQLNKTANIFVTTYKELQ